MGGHDWNGRDGLWPVARQKTRIGSEQISPALALEELAINANITDEHFQSAFKNVANDLAVPGIGAFGERNTVGQGPGITLAGDGAELVSDGQTFVMRGNNGSEEFAGEFVPEVIEEVLHGATDAAVIIGCAQENNIGALDARAQGRVGRGIMGSIGIVKAEGFLLEIEQIDGTT